MTELVPRKFRSCYWHDPGPCVSVTAVADEADEALRRVVAAGTSAAAASIEPLACSDASGDEWAV